MKREDCLAQPIIHATLTEAGWYPGRFIIPYEWEFALIRQGLTLVDAAVPIMSEFGGLILKPPYLKDALWWTETINLDIREPEDALYWSKQFDRLLWPIGESDSTFLMVDEAGAVYGDCLNELVFIGEDFYDALDLLILRNRRWQEVRFKGA